MDVGHGAMDMGDDDKTTSLGNGWCFGCCVRLSPTWTYYFGLALFAPDGAVSRMPVVAGLVSTGGAISLVFTIRHGRGVSASPIEASVFRCSWSSSSRFGWAGMGLVGISGALRYPNRSELPSCCSGFDYVSGTLLHCSAILDRWEHVYLYDSISRGKIDTCGMQGLHILQRYPESSALCAI